MAAALVTNIADISTDKSSTDKSTASESKVRLLLLDANTGQTVADFAVPAGAIGRIAFSRDGGLLAAACGDYRLPGEVLVFQVASGKHLAHLKGHSSQVHSLAFTADGSRLASRAGERGGTTGEVIVWDVTGGKLLLTLKESAGGWGDLAFSADNHRLLSAGANLSPTNPLHSWDATPLPNP